MIPPIGDISLEEIQLARRRLGNAVVRTPLLPWNGNEAIHLKPENLQSIGSFKLRGAGNALRAAVERGQANDGVYTASAGNMAQGLAWNARQVGIPCSVVV